MAKEYKLVTQHSYISEDGRHNIVLVAGTLLSADEVKKLGIHPSQLTEPDGMVTNCGDPNDVPDEARVAFRLTEPEKPSKSPGSVDKDPDDPDKKQPIGNPKPVTVRK